MDASASIGERDFQKERDFVKAVADSFTFAHDQALVGVITYSDNATLDIPLGQYMSAERFKLEVDRIPYILGRTRIDRALKLASTDIFSRKGRSRPGFPKIMIILTDGVQTPDPDAVALDQAVIPLRRSGVRVFAVGVGGHTRPSELRLMVERPDDVFMAANFDDLLQKTYQIAERTCEGIKENPGKLSY
jgi:collagen type VI alpha